jgi:uncharacterized membrane protein
VDEDRSLLSAREQRRQPLTGWQRSLTIRATRLSYWISRRWLFLFNFVIAIYIGVPFLAPLLMKQGLEGSARVIYKIYSPACHQMAHRSWFLFGDQSFYPFELSGIPGVHYLDEYLDSIPSLEGLEPDSNFFAYTGHLRNFYGSEELGYKVALCQRDVAIYLSLLLGGILFSLIRGRLRPMPWQLFLLVGILPMGIDGGYQMLTYLLPRVFEAHETTPALRTITGTLLGFCLVWLTYPHIYRGMQETETDLRANLFRAGELGEE